MNDGPMSFFYPNINDYDSNGPKHDGLGGDIEFCRLPPPNNQWQAAAD